MKLARPPRFRFIDAVTSLLTTDGHVQAALGAAILVLITPGATYPGEDLSLLARLPSLLLAGVLVLATGRDLDRLSNPDERAFWDDFLLATAVLTASLAAQLAVPLLGPEVPRLAGRLLLTVAFALLLLAVERRPDRAGSWRPRKLERRLALQAVTVLTVGLVVYFAVLPGAAGDPEVSTRAAGQIFSIFGLLLLLRLVHLGATARGRRWRVLYRVLSVTAAGICLHYLQRVEPFELFLEPMLEPIGRLVWIVPILALVLAARLRHLPFPVEWAPDGPARGEEDPLEEIRAGVGTRTLLLALAVPVLHHGGYALSLFDPRHADAREIWTVVWTIALGLVVFVQRQRLEGSLRRALDDQERIEKTLRASERRLRLADTRRATDEALVASREKYTKAFRHSPHGLVIVTLAEGRHVDCNESYLEILGRARAEVLGRTAEELDLLTDAAEKETIGRALRTTGSVERRTTFLRRSNGEAARVRFSAESLALEDERCALVVVEDLSTEDGRRAESEAKAGLFDRLADAAVGIDGEGVVRAWNRAATRLFGVPAARAEGRAVAEVLGVEPPRPAVGIWLGPLDARVAGGEVLRLEVFTTRVDTESGASTGTWVLVARRMDR